MPLSRHAFYMKEDILYSEPGSARESIDGVHDFYKGAKTSQKMNSKRMTDSNNNESSATNKLLT